MKTRLWIYLVYLVGYYAIVACMYALTNQGLILVAEVIPIIVLGGVLYRERRHLVRHLESHHPDTWPSLASEWYLNKYSSIRFIFSDRLDGDLELLTIKRSNRHFIVLTGAAGALVLITVWIL